MIPGVGGKTARQILELYPDPEELFKENRKALEATFGKRAIVDHILEKAMFPAAEQEMEFVTKNDIRILFVDDADYPQRLKRPDCDDTPILLYYKGNADLNCSKTLSIVGSRKATDYGRSATEQLVKELSSENMLIVSGLAYGIDSTSHQAALNNGLPTVGVLGHGLNLIYPAQNRNIAKEMIANGGLLTEFPSNTKLDPGLFPARNRIIAALSDVVVVMESAKKGGALITAEIANSYNRDVFALPGRINDTYSEGCNMLIRSNKANLLTSADDIFYITGWKRKKNQKAVQQSLFQELVGEEKLIYDLLLQHKELTIDEISSLCDLSLPKIAKTLLTLELKNVCKFLPGKIYKLV
ncbi:MAG: DNA-processing protein DprA [Bacteroidales bacterium]|nr:DNA-processing protein DprA [Bacteroidales bacterium]